MGRNRPYFPTPLAVIRNYAYPSMTKRLTTSKATTNKGCLKQTTANAGTKTAESSPKKQRRFRRLWRQETTSQVRYRPQDRAIRSAPGKPNAPPMPGYIQKNASAYGHASLARTSADSRIPTLPYINDPRGGPSIPKDPPLGHTTVDRPLRNPSVRAALGPLLFSRRTIRRIPAHLKRPGTIFPMGIFGKPSLTDTFFLFEQLFDRPERREGEYPGQRRQQNVMRNQRQSDTRQSQQQENPPATGAPVILGFNHDGMEQSDNQKCSDSYNQTEQAVFDQKFHKLIFLRKPSDPQPRALPSFRPELSSRPRTPSRPSGCRPHRR